MKLRRGSCPRGPLRSGGADHVHVACGAPEGGRGAWAGWSVGRLGRRGPAAGCAMLSVVRTAYAVAPNRCNLAGRAFGRAAAGDTCGMSEDDVFIVHGPADPAVPLVLDSPHSGSAMPPDFGSVRSAAELREGEDCFIDELVPAGRRKGRAAAGGAVPAHLPRRQPPRRRHRPDLLDGPGRTSWCPAARRASARRWCGARWTTAGRSTTAAHRSRCASASRAATSPTTGAAAACWMRAPRFGVVHHINCHSMNAVSGVMGEGGAGQARADFVLGDRDGSTCAPEFTAFVRDFLAGAGLRREGQRPVQGRGTGARLRRPGRRPPQPAAGSQQAPVHGQARCRSTRLAVGRGGRLRRRAGGLHQLGGHRLPGRAALGATPAQTASWMWALGLGMG
jgi:N-formylglutamate deformylase